MINVKKIVLLILIVLGAVIGVAAFAMVISNSESLLTINNSTESSQQVTEISLQVDNPVMYINGREQYIDVEERGTVPVIINGRTLVPIRAVIEAMGGTVGWDGTAQTVILARGDDIIKLTIGSDTAYFNNTAHTLDAAPVIVNDVTMLPIRFVAESFSFKVDWDASSSTITITDSNPRQTKEKKY